MATDKITRMIMLYHKLIDGKIINKLSFIKETEITERTFARDIEDIRLFLSEIYSTSELLFDKSKEGYYLKGYTKSKFSSAEIIAVLKILLDSRAFPAEDIETLMRLMINSTPVYEQSALSTMIEDELKTYPSLQHKKALFNKVWEVEQAILRKEKLKINYTKANGDTVERIIIPISVSFSEFYFYIIAFMDSKNYTQPTFFRIDRINYFTSLEKYKDDALYSGTDIAQLKKKLQFMQGGENMTITFKFWGDSLEAVLDRLPCSKVVGTEDGKAIVEAEVFGRGVKMWLLSQAQFLEIIDPPEFRIEMQQTIQQMLNNYI